MRKLYLILAIPLFIGCNRDDDASKFQSQSFVKQYISSYMIDIFDTNSVSRIESTYYINILENDGRNYIKRKLSVEKEGANDHSKSTNIDIEYDEITTNENEIKITRCFLDDAGKLAFKSNFPRLIKINNGKMVEKKIEGKILQFGYEGNKITTITETSSGIEGIVSKTYIYYNNQGNVDSLVTNYGRFDFTDPDNYKYIYDENNIKSKDKIILSNYDTVNNPFKSLIIFDDAFLRALSNNNFRSYQKIEYTKNFIPGFSISEPGKYMKKSEEIRNWEFKYINGELVYY